MNGSFAAKAVAAASILALGLSSSGCSTSSSSAQPVDALQLASTGGAQSGSLRVVPELPPPAQNGGEQPISPNDVLQVDVFQVDNLDRTVQVDATGKISLPLVGSVQAAGRTARQLEEEIESAYGAKYLQSPG